MLLRLTHSLLRTIHPTEYKEGIFLKYTIVIKLDIKTIVAIVFLDYFMVKKLLIRFI